MTILVTILCSVLASAGSVFASAGFWNWLNSRHRVDDAERRMVLGIGYRCICSLASGYINDGKITHSQYKDLIHYLYEPYKEMGGDGTVERLISEVKKLNVVND